MHQKISYTSSQFKVEHNQEIGKAKQELFKQAFRRIEYSISKGFHLEAITIIESLMCDRLETSVSVLNGEKIKPMNLGPLLKIAKGLPEFPQELIIEIDSWRKDRNLVMHQMVKITHHEVFDWHSRMKYARVTAVTGNDLVKKLHLVVGKIKRNHKRSNR